METAAHEVGAGSSLLAYWCVTARLTHTVTGLHKPRDARLSRSVLTAELGKKFIDLLDVGIDVLVKLLHWFGVFLG